MRLHASQRTHATRSCTWGLVALIVSKLHLRVPLLDDELTIMPRPALDPLRGSGERLSRTRAKPARVKRSGSALSATPTERWEMESCGAIEIGKIELVVEHR
jgi:hypothetical protein